MGERIIHKIVRAEDGTLCEVASPPFAPEEMLEGVVKIASSPLKSFDTQEDREVLTGEVVDVIGRRHLSSRAVRYAVKMGGVALVFGSLYGVVDYAATRVMYGRELSIGDVVKDVTELPETLMDGVDSVRGFMGGVRKVEEVKNTLTGGGQ